MMNSTFNKCLVFCGIYIYTLLKKILNFKALKCTENGGFFPVMQDTWVKGPVKIYRVPMTGF